MKKIMIIILTLTLLITVGCNSEEGRNPSGDKCEIDSDCVCTLTCPDCCGKTGQTWKCIDNKCQLGFFGE